MTLPEIWRDLLDGGHYWVFVVGMIVGVAWLGWIVWDETGNGEDTR